ncbi:hypothetical protein GCM10023335_61810 [Streptomyces siamensis]|uniref:Uncharacterized protein n=1 Tax=Streptomyces siamensis TaxID=1274986 RepID=A0ABP9JAV1_9ACTN
MAFVMGTGGSVDAAGSLTSSASLASFASGAPGFGGPCSIGSGVDGMSDTGPPPNRQRTAHGTP